MSGMTSDTRFPGQLNCDFHEFVVNLFLSSALFLHDDLVFGSRVVQFCSSGPRCRLIRVPISANMLAAMRGRDVSMANAGASNSQSNEVKGV